MSSNLDQKLSLAIEQWKEFWKTDLESIYLYGSAARNDWSHKSSDINLLLQVSGNDHYAKWPDASELSRRLFKKGFAIPLILTKQYIESSLDVFPIEFLDIKLFHRVLAGSDDFDKVEINKPDLRAQAEREVKGKWVQLRQAFLERGGNTSEMRNLLAQTVPTWISVFQALLYLEDHEIPESRRDVLANGSKICGLDSDIFLDLEKVRKNKLSLNRNLAKLHLEKLMKQADILARFIDEYGMK